MYFSVIFYQLASSIFIHALLPRAPVWEAISYQATEMTYLSLVAFSIHMYCHSHRPRLL